MLIGLRYGPGAPVFLALIVLGFGVLLGVQLGFSRPRMLWVRRIDAQTMTLGGWHPTVVTTILEAATQSQ